MQASFIKGRIVALLALLAIAIVCFISASDHLAFAKNADAHGDDGWWESHADEQRGASHVRIGGGVAALAAAGLVLVATRRKRGA
jgi:hypothetical protein